MQLSLRVNISVWRIPTVEHPGTGELAELAPGPAHVGIVCHQPVGSLAVGIKHWKGGAQMTDIKTLFKALLYFSLPSYLHFWFHQRALR